MRAYARFRQGQSHGHVSRSSANRELDALARRHRQLPVDKDVRFESRVIKGLRDRQPELGGSTIGPVLGELRARDGGFDAHIGAPRVEQLREFVHVISFAHATDK